MIIQFQSYRVLKVLGISKSRLSRFSFLGRQKLPSLAEKNKWIMVVLYNRSQMIHIQEEKKGVEGVLR